jgi:hypothetical protein
LIRTHFRAAVLWVAAAFTLVMAALPHPPRLPGQPEDKILHILAFVVLTALALAAYPRAAWWRVVLGLSAFGALIEFVQAIPALHRDADWLDWVADTGAVLVVLALALGIRRLLRR